MLQLVNIAKQYRTEDLVQNALDGVTLNLRDQEFVAILGPSGSGKTTLLNVIGGLDHYDSGDLIINGVSTQDYADRDWDTYRNHSIGFVFQSYNLIPHQSVLSNVELALTISGVSVSERKKRAKEALEKVGLGAHINKKPSQLSGGQMQRVAIARALVNDPDIVLADEPTGALDSETSVQVMDLLKEVAEDRLVVMVTHNPELAEEYATRIVRIRDGKVTDDTDPFLPGEEPVKRGAAVAAGAGAATAAETAGTGSEPAAGVSEAEEFAEAQDVTKGGSFARSGKKKSSRKAAMSFLTALSLSFNNLKTKKARTILVAIAGSIGIIGIALIQSMSNGVNDYIADIEENTVSQYPISIDSTGVNVAAYMAMFNELNEKNTAESDDVTINQVLHNYASGLTNNDLKSLKKFLEEESHVDEYARALEYSYSITPQIYRLEKGEIRRIHPDESLDSMGMRFEQVQMLNLVAFFRLPQNDNLYKDDYEIKAGHWPENDRECVVVLGSDGSITDICAYAIGLKDAADLDELIRKLMEGEDIRAEEYPGVFTYDDIIGTEFKVINSSDYYVYDAENDFWTNRTSSKSFLKRKYDAGQDLVITGVVLPKEDADGMLESGIYYTSSFITGLIRDAADSDVVHAQLDNRSINILNGKKFGESSDMDELQLSDLLSVDEEMVQKAFSFDMEDLEFDESMFEDLDFSGLDLSQMADLSALSFDLSLPYDKIRQMFEEISFNATPEETQEVFSGIVQGFVNGAGAEDIKQLQTVNETVSAYLQSDEVRGILQAFVAGIINDAVSRIEIDPSWLDPSAFDPSVIDPSIIDPSAVDPENFDPSAFDPAAFDPQSIAEAAFDPQALIEQITANISITEEQLRGLAEELASGFAAYYSESAAPDIEKVLTDLGTDLSEYMGAEEVQKQVTDFVTQHLDTGNAEALFGEITSEVSADVQQQIANAMTQVFGALASSLGETLTTQISSSIENAMENMGSQIEDAFAINEDMLAEAFQFNMSEDSVKDLFSTMAADASTTYDSNLLAMGYSDLEDPVSISIYSKDFSAKADILNILDTYNENMKDVDNGAKVITYSDIAGTMMSSVSSIIGVISTVLIALVAISLIVSSIMIGVITYISVLERKKEIGILRALGASKRNVADVFNAETFITGLFAGLLGVIVSALLTIPVNWLIHDVAGHPEISAYLDPRAAILLIILSVFLNILAGFLPSRKASKSNPVTALRDE